MNKKSIVIPIVIIFVFNILTQVAIATCENNFGIVENKIRIKDEYGEWDGWETSYSKNSVADEIFQVRTNVTIKENCDIEIVLSIDEQVSAENHTRMFEIIDGVTSDFGKRKTFENCIKGESKEYIWTIKQIHNNTKDGIFNFNTDVAFIVIKPEEQEIITGYCGALCQLLLSEPNQDETDTSENEKDNNIVEEDNVNINEPDETPGFELVFLALAVVLVFLFKRRRV